MLKSNRVRMLPVLLSLGVMAPAMAQTYEPAQASSVDMTPLSVDTGAAAQQPASGSVAADEQGLFNRLWVRLGGESEVRVQNPGVRADAWLTVQRDGLAASGNPQAASAVQREKAAERFLKTYDYAIKESYYGTSFKAGSGGN